VVHTPMAQFVSENLVKKDKEGFITPETRPYLLEASKRGIACRDEEWYQQIVASTYAQIQEAKQSVNAIPAEQKAEPAAVRRSLRSSWDGKSLKAADPVARLEDLTVKLAFAAPRDVPIKADVDYYVAHLTSLVNDIAKKDPALLDQVQVLCQKAADKNLIEPRHFQALSRSLAAEQAKTGQNPQFDALASKIAFAAPRDAVLDDYKTYMIELTKVIDDVGKKQPELLPQVEKLCQQAVDKKLIEPRHLEALARNIERYETIQAAQSSHK
nr:hypothetical protein [Pseudomonadota bacterium]